MPHAVMKVDDFEKLLTTFCSLTEPFSKVDFVHALERTKHFSESTRDSYFFLARKLGLFEMKSRDDYRKTTLGKKACNLFKKRDFSKLKKVLANTLKLKEPNFAKFLDYLRKPRTYDEIVKWSNPAAAQTLTYWVTWLGLAEYRGTPLRYLLLPVKTKKINKKKFWDFLWRSYRMERETSVVGIRAAFVKIPQIRDTVCGLSGITIPVFNKALKSLLDDSVYRDRIEIGSAPLTRILDDERVFRESVKPFNYKKRNYYYIALKGGGSNLK